jgi:hypothetical protein
MSKETEMKLNEIREIENKYGVILFYMGLTHLLDVGRNNLDDAAVENGIKAILAQGKANESSRNISMITPGFKFAILRCSAELAKFSPLTLFCYIKKYLIITNLGME